MSHLANILLLAHIYCSLYVSLDLTCVCALDYDNKYGPEYGNEWIYYMDDNGTTHTLNFSSYPSDTRGMIFGDVYFYLYTRRNCKAETLTVPRDNKTIDSKYFNASNDVKILTHGWLSGESAEWLQNIKTSFLKKNDFNVIIVDWSEFADNPIYPWPAFSTRYVGKQIAKLLTAFKYTYNTGGERVHLIGHSLGAQVMGYAGMFSPYQVKRITGLDPARPLFEVPRMGKDFRLEKSDAAFVDIIHSCGGIYGYCNSHGHADFYPNDGRPRQPGCSGIQQMIEACSHGRANEFFEESINSETPFIAYPCESWEKFKNGECRDNPTFMGYPAVEDHQGDHYLNTRAEPKYAMGDEN